MMLGENSPTNSVAGLPPSVLRRANSIEVFHAIRLGPTISQREIAERTGIDKSTVSTVVSYFDSLGLLVRTLGEKPYCRGRPSEALSLRAEAGLLIGIDIVPDKTTIVSAGLDGAPIDVTMHPTIADVPDVASAVISALRGHLRNGRRRLEEVRSIGVCIPGLINPSGLLAESDIFHWQELALQKPLRKKLGRPVWVGNDARGAGIAEKFFGRCIDVKDFVFIDSHSGVGGALFLGGSLYVGAGGFAGEVGHLKVVPYGRICSCGASGCLSAYVSQPALQQRFARHGFSVSSFEEMRALAEVGDSKATAILDEAGEVLGIAISDLLNLFNVPNIVLGGGLAVLAAYLLPATERVVRRQTLATPLAQSRLLVSELALREPSRAPLAIALDGLSRLATEGPFPW
jgi:predicted NBD/HSP70 family sugar kinase